MSVQGFLRSNLSRFSEECSGFLWGVHDFFLECTGFSEEYPWFSKECTGFLRSVQGFHSIGQGF